MANINEKILFILAAGVLIVVPLISNSVPSQGFFLVGICGLILLLFWIREILEKARLQLRATRLDRPIVGLFFVSFVSLLFTNYKIYGLRRLSELFFYILFYFAIVNFLNSEKRLRQLIWIICAGCFLVSFYGLAQYLDISFVGWEVQPWGEVIGRRIFASLGNPNWLASYLVLCLPLIISLFLFSPAGKQKNFLLLLLGMSFFCLLLTKSLSGYFSFLFSFFFFIALLRKTELLNIYRRKLALTSLILVVLITVFAINEQPRFSKRAGSFIERLLRYRASLEIMKDHPLFGVGLGNSLVYADLYVAKFIQDPRYKMLWPKEQSLTPMMRDRSENEYLDIGSETGILGLGCFAWLIIAIFGGHISHIKKIKDIPSKILLTGTYAAFGANLIDNLLGFPLHVVPTALLFFIILGINGSLEKERFYELRAQFVEKNKAVLNRAVAVLALLFFFMMARQFVAEVYLAKGLQFKNWQKDKEAAGMYLEAKKWDASIPEIYIELGISHRLLGNFDEAISSLEHYITLRPFHSLALYNLGFAYFMQRNYDLAIKYYKMAIELKPMLAYLWQKLGEAYVAKGENQLAAGAFETALNYNPDNVDASIGLRQAVGIKEEGEKTTQEKEIDMHFKKAQGYIDQMELDLAAAEYKKALKLNPQNSSALSNSAVVYIWKGMIERAEACLRGALEIDPQNILAQKNLEAISPRTDFTKISPKPKDNFADVPILMYHKIEDKTPTQYWVKTEEFEKQMKSLSNYGYTTITLKDLYNFRYKNTPLPEKPVVLTFDDGYKDFYENAYPILKKYNFTSTVFIIPDAIGREDRVYEELPGEPFASFMDEKMIMDLVKEGVSFGSHSWNHPTLTILEEAKWDKEIVESKKYLEEKFGTSIGFFCYPYGKFDPPIEEKVKEAGYLGAVFAHGGVEEITTADFHALRRILIKGGKDDPDNLLDFIKKVDPAFTIPEIKITSIKAFDSGTNQPKDEFKPGEKILIKIEAMNSGDSTDVSAGLSLKVKKDGQETIIYPVKDKRKRSSKDTPEEIKEYYLSAINFAFDTTENFEFAIVLPKKIPEGELLVDLVFKDKYLLMDYLSQIDVPIFK